MANTGISPRSHDDKHLRIGAVARRSGCAVESLRFYEARGLITPARRTTSGYRLYDESVLERLSFIKKAQSAGFSLDEIARIVAVAGTGKRPCGEVRRLAAAKLKEIDHRLAEMRAMRARLKSIVEQWERAGEADGTVCGLIESLANGKP